MSGTDCVSETQTVLTLDLTPLTSWLLSFVNALNGLS